MHRIQSIYLNWSFTLSAPGEQSLYTNIVIKNTYQNLHKGLNFVPENYQAHLWSNWLLLNRCKGFPRTIDKHIFVRYIWEQVHDKNSGILSKSSTCFHNRDTASRYTYTIFPNCISFIFECSISCFVMFRQVYCFVSAQARLLAALLRCSFMSQIILNRMLSKAIFYTDKCLNILNNVQGKKI